MTQLVHPFRSVIVESYDRETGSIEEMEAILSLVNWVAARAMTLSSVKELNPVVQINQDWLVGGFINYIRQPELRLVEEALDRAGLSRSNMVHRLNWNGSKKSVDAI